MIQNINLIPPDSIEYKLLRFIYMGGKDKQLFVGGINSQISQTLSLVTQRRLSDVRGSHIYLYPVNLECHQTSNKVSPPT